MPMDHTVGFPVLVTPTRSGLNLVDPQFVTTGCGKLSKGLVSDEPNIQ